MMRRIFLHVPLGPGNVLRNADCLLFNKRPVENPNAGPVPRLQAFRTIIRPIQVHADWLFFRDKMAAPQRGLVVVAVFRFAFRQFHLFVWHFPVGNQTQQMRDAIESCSFLVIGANGVPGRVLGIRCFEHAVACAGVSYQRRKDSKSMGLSFHCRSGSLSAETHHVFHAGTVVPASVENYDLPCGGKILHITLQIHPRFFTIGRRRQCNQTKYARTHSLGNRTDCAALSGGIASFKDNDNAKTFARMSPPLRCRRH
jgi:hypothetical protein